MRIQFAHTSPPSVASRFELWAIPMPGLAERIRAPLPSRTAGYQKRHRPPVALVSGSIGRPQPVLLVHRTQDNIEDHEHHDDGTVCRHAWQEQEESQSTEVARVAGEAECPCPHHLVVVADRRSLRLRGWTNFLSRKEVP